MAVPHQPKEVICVSGEDICSAPMTTKVPNSIDPQTKKPVTLFNRTDHDVTHMTSTHLTKDASGKVNGGRIALYTRPLGHPTDANGEPLWQLAGTSSDGGKTWVSTAAITPAQKASLNDPNGVLRKNGNQQTVSALRKAGTSEPDIKTLLTSTTNQAVVDPTTQTKGRDNPFDEVVSPDTPLSGNSVPDAITPRKNFGKDHIYPLDLGSTDQDILKIDMVEYEAAGLDYTKGTGREQAGEGNREIIGTVILPIPSGIRDYNNVDWGSNDLNSVELAAAKVAMETIERGGSGFKDEVNKVMDAAEGTDARDALKNLFTAGAIGKGFKDMMARSAGKIMNPNMELLFNNPVLRPFEFTFLLAPRTSDESKAIARIIRFFKQGMAAKRTEGNLFLKSPNTFQLTYKHRGSKGSDHPYLNKFKECALKSCNINYTPNQSYSTYTDGAMTSYTMSLSFMELTPIYEDDYEEGATEESLNSGESFPAAIGF